MKTVYMTRDFDYQPHPRKTVRFRAGVSYTRVLENAARQIERSGAGCVIPPDVAGDRYLTRDASHAWTTRRRG